MSYSKIETNGLIMRRRSKRIWFVALGVFVAVSLFSFLALRFRMDEDVDAASMANFDPGYIISDWQMSNYNSMNESDIQAFLKSKNSCYDTNIGKYTTGEKVGYFSEISPPRTWHVQDGHFVCMADEVFNGGTAAHIIYRAAQDYRINPQVLLVLLEKEQSLVTDTFPHSQQYRSATGYGCPDTAPCSSQYYGLQNQIRKAAELFRTVLDGGWTNYPLGNNYVQYNPNPDCGGTVVNIRSLATSALYRYTPYQPNSAVLNGWNDGCGAYGNMNFYKLFEDWFGGITNTVEVKKRRVVDPAEPGVKQTGILDGVSYVVASGAGNDYALDIYGGNQESGANVQLYKKHYGVNQQFRFIYNSNGFYEIVNVTSGKSLNVYGGYMDEETNVQLWSRDGSCGSFWRIDKNADGTYTIQSSCSDLVLDIYGGSALNEKNIQVYFSHGGGNQHWLLEEVRQDDNAEKEVEDERKVLEGASYTIISALDANYALDIYGGVSNAKSGTNVQLYSRHGGENQRFSLIYNSESGLYEIVNSASNKSLNTYGGFTLAGANVQLWSRDGSCASYWKLNRNDDNTYTIQSSCSDLVLDIYGGSALNEKNIQIYTNHGGANQRWFFEKQG